MCKVTRPLKGKISFLDEVQFSELISPSKILVFVKKKSIVTHVTIYREKEAEGTREYVLL